MEPESLPFRQAASPRTTLSSKGLFPSKQGVEAAGEAVLRPHAHSGLVGPPGRNGNSCSDKVAVVGDIFYSERKFLCLT